MARDLFSVTIFFIVFRETLEAAIIVSVLLGLVEQIIHEDPNRLAQLKDAEPRNDPESPPNEKKLDDPSASSDASSTPELTSPEGEDATAKRLLRKMRFQIFFGAALGLLIAGGIGAAFIAVWFTQASDLWANTENLWEGKRSRLSEVSHGSRCLHMQVSSPSLPLSLSSSWASRCSRWTALRPSGALSFSAPSPASVLLPSSSRPPHDTV